LQSWKMAGGGTGVALADDIVKRYAPTKSFSPQVRLRGWSDVASFVQI
jgi:hypothetical protein